MNEMYFRMASIQKKMEQNRKLQVIMYGVTALVVFSIFICSLNEVNTMKAAWIISMLSICIFFGINVFYIYQNKKLEYKMYECEKEELENKKKAAEIKGESLPDAVLKREIQEPSKEIFALIGYYVTMMILDILVKVVLHY